jgi:hypothetical protein
VTGTVGESSGVQPEADTLHVDVHAASAFMAMVAVTAIPAAAAAEIPAGARHFTERR